MATATVINTTEQPPVTSLSALENQIKSQQMELSRLEAAIREARTKLAEMTSQYDAQLKRLANGEAPDVDIPDLKEKINVLSDVVRQMQADCEAKRKTLNVLCDELSVLKAQGTKAEELRPPKSPLERKIQTQQKELSRVEAAIREAQTKLAEITSQYNAQLKRVANGEEPAVDIPDLKRKINVLSDLISQMQADHEAKRKKLRVLYAEMSVVEAEKAEAEELRKLAVTDSELRAVREKIQKMCDELYALRGREIALRQKSSWDRRSIYERKREREKLLRERGGR